MTARNFSIRFSLCFAFLMVGAGVQLPFLPLWLQAKGLNSSEIAGILAGMFAARAVASPLLAALADKIHNRILVVRACAAFSVSAFLVLAQMEGFWPICIAALGAAFVFAPVFPLVEGYCIDGSARNGSDYGRMRLWASVSFLSGSLVSGALLTQLPIELAVWLMLGGQFCSLFATLMLPPEPKGLELQDLPAHSNSSAWRILLGSKFTLVLLAVSAGQSSHGMLFGFATVHWNSLGFSTFLIGVFWTAAVAMEVVLFAFSKGLVVRFGAEYLMCIGLAGGIVRWIGMSFATEAWAMIILQMLHSVTFATTHLGTMHFIHRTVPTRMRNRAQGMYAAISGGVLMASVTWGSGYLFSTFGALGFMVMAVISLFALLLAAIVALPLRNTPEA